jgi:hypothetical protein
MVFNMCQGQEGDLETTTGKPRRKTSRSKSGGKPHALHTLARDPMRKVMVVVSDQETRKLVSDMIFIRVPMQSLPTH